MLRIYTVQNGPDECYLNTIQACAIDVWSVVVRPSFNNVNQLVVEPSILLLLTWPVLVNIYGCCILLIFNEFVICRTSILVLFTA